jgi:hypothetical protein
MIICIVSCLLVFSFIQLEKNTSSTWLNHLCREQDHLVIYMENQTKNDRREQRSGIVGYFVVASCALWKYATNILPQQEREREIRETRKEGQGRDHQNTLTWPIFVPTVSLLLLETIESLQTLLLPQFFFWNSNLKLAHPERMYVTLGMC